MYNNLYRTKNQPIKVEKYNTVFRGERNDMSESEFGKKKPLWFRMLLPLLKLKKLPELPANPKTGKWYRVYPKGCVDAEGKRTYAHYSQGTENKLIVFFCGGGFSINEYTAARPMKLDSVK